MTYRRLAAIAVLLLAASTLVVAGVAAFSQPAGLIVAGILLAGWTWLVFGEVR